MLAFLDSLCAALIARDAARIRRLLGHPLARALPRAVRDEANAIANGVPRRFTAPLQAMRLYHQTAHLLGVRGDPAIRTPSLNAGRRQLEMPFEILAS
jgi:hypothetical protein